MEYWFSLEFWKKVAAKMENMEQRIPLNSSWLTLFLFRFPEYLNEYLCFTHFYIY